MKASHEILNRIQISNTPGVIEHIFLHLFRLNMALDVCLTSQITSCGQSEGDSGGLRLASCSIFKNKFQTW